MDRALSQNPPTIKMLDGTAGGEPYEVTWKRLAPGHFTLTRELEEGSVVRGSIQAGRHALPFGPIAVGSSTEWTFEPERLAELRAASAATGGRELIDLSKAWLRPPANYESDLRIPLVIVALLLMLLDALISRMGWTLPSFALPQGKPFQTTQAAPAGTPSNSPTAATETRPSAKPTPPSSPEQPGAESSPPAGPPTQRTSRFDRAKRRK
jgi:hypothetical protein